MMLLSLAWGAIVGGSFVVAARHSAFWGMPAALLRVGLSATALFLLSAHHPLSAPLGLFAFYVTKNLLLYREVTR